MQQKLSWALIAFFIAFFVFQSMGYERARAREKRLGTIEGQAERLRDWLELDRVQLDAYLEFRHAIVAKEKEFADYRKADAKAFLEANLDTIPDDEEKLYILKERHLAKLKQIKSEGLDLWSEWIDTLTFEQRRKYVGKVFEHRPLNTSWYDRDFLDDL